MPDRSLTVEQVLTMLAAAPPRIASLSSGLEPAQLRQTPRQDEWSANDVLAHLRSCADVWGKCIAAILTQDTPRIRAISPRAWIKKTDYLDQEFQPSLRAYAAQRTDLLAVLEPLAPEGWLRAATVTGAGKTLEWTVLSYAQRMALHERPHLMQIERIADSVRA